MLKQIGNYLYHKMFQSMVVSFIRVVSTQIMRKTLKLNDWTRVDVGANYKTQINQVPTVINFDITNLFDKSIGLQQVPMITRYFNTGTTW